MHKKEQDLHRYLDGELEPEQNAEIEKHLVECETCQAHLDELKALAAVLQSWTLPAELTALQQPILLPARQAKTPLKIGIFGWISGIAVAVLFMMIRAIFLLSDQLNWATRLVSELGFNHHLEQLTATLGEIFILRPFYLSPLSTAGESIILLLTLMLPVLLYVVCVGGVTILFLNWFTMTFVKPAKQVRS